MTSTTEDTEHTEAGGAPRMCMAIYLTQSHGDASMWFVKH